MPQCRRCARSARRRAARTGAARRRGSRRSTLPHQRGDRRYAVDCREVEIDPRKVYAEVGLQRHDQIDRSRGVEFPAEEQRLVVEPCGRAAALAEKLVDEQADFVGAI